VAHATKLCRYAVPFLENIDQLMNKTVAAQDQPRRLLTDKTYGTNYYLTKAEASYRSSIVSQVDYKLTIALPKGGKTFKGHVVISFLLKEASAQYPLKNCLFADFRGKSVKSFKINDHYCQDETIFDQGRLYIPQTL
jgi:hypothetical protein